LQVFDDSLDRCCGWRNVIITTLFCSVCNHLSIVKHLLPGYNVQNLEGMFIIIRLSVCFSKIHHHSLWEFRTCM
jgi:hypothetical protein